MMRSLFSAVSGIKTHQTRMDVIGNNIANVNTVAYKSQAVTFKDVYYQTTQTASGPNEDTGRGGTNAQQIGLGSGVGSVSTSVLTQGATERTDNPYDLCLSGNSFFIVNNSGTTYFTRAGDFTVDESGALVTGGGANVMGWQVDDDGNVVKDTVSPLYATSDKFMYTQPVATEGVTMTGNVNVDSTDTDTYTFSFVDSVGNEYQASVNLVYQETTSGIKSYAMTAPAKGAVTKNGAATDLTFTISGTLDFSSSTGKPTVDMAGLTCTFAASTTPASDETATDLANIGALTNPADPTNSTRNATIAMDFTGMTNFKNATKILYSKGITNADGSKVTAGKPAGKMTSVGVNESGQLVASYNNGDTRVIGQIAVTTFANAYGLEKVGGNLYSATLNSGEFDGVGVDVTSTSGKITSGYLEMSNVDLSSEFTTLITTQRGYQANSRIITVSDTLLEELINLKR